MFFLKVFLGGADHFDSTNYTNKKEIEEFELINWFLMVAYRVKIYVDE